MEKYVILSLTHSDGNTPCFWKANNAGYTVWPFNAGIYTAAEVNEDKSYYDNGSSTIAIPLTESGMASIGLKITMDLKKVKSLIKK